MTTGLNYGTADYDPDRALKWALESNPLYERVKDLESRLKEAEAQAAIKHDALERLVAIYEGEHDPEAVGGTRPAWIQSALASDAGRNILTKITLLQEHVKSLQNRECRSCESLQRTIDERNDVIIRASRELKRLRRENEAFVSLLKETRERCGWIDRDCREADKVMCGTQGIRTEITRVLAKFNRLHTERKEADNA